MVDASALYAKLKIVAHDLPAFRDFETVFQGVVHSAASERPPPCDISVQLDGWTFPSKEVPKIAALLDDVFETDVVDVGVSNVFCDHTFDALAQLEAKMLGDVSVRWSAV